jgi:hypothetical protein
VAFQSSASGAFGPVEGPACSDGAGCLVSGKIGPASGGWAGFTSVAFPGTGMFDPVVPGVAVCGAGLAATQAVIFLLLGVCNTAADKQGSRRQ